MKNLLLFALLLTLPLLLGGCGKEPVVEVKPESDSVNAEELEERESIWYLKDSETPYSGKVYALHPNGQKMGEGNYKDGKMDGLHVKWNENGKLAVEIKFVDGNALVTRSWDSDGKFKGSEFSDYYSNLDMETKNAEFRIESQKKIILDIENEIPKDEAKKHFKKYYLELSELEKKLIQIKAEISSIKEIKEQWDKEAEAE